MPSLSIPSRDMIHGKFSDLGEISDRIEAPAGIECETKDALIGSVSKGMPRVAVPTGCDLRGDPVGGLELTDHTETAIGINRQVEHGNRLTLESAGDRGEAQPTQEYEDGSNAELETIRGCLIDRARGRPPGRPNGLELSRLASPRPGSLAGADPGPAGSGRASCQMARSSASPRWSLPPRPASVVLNPSLPLVEMTRTIAIPQ